VGGRRRPRLAQDALDLGGDPHPRRAAAADHQVTGDVAELADVAGPGVAHQPGDDRGRQPGVRVGAGGAAGGPGDAAAGSGEPAGPAHPGGNPAPAPARRRRTYRSPSEVSEDELIATLQAHGFRVQAAAAALRVSRPALYLLIDACPALRKASELERDEIETCRRDCDGDLEAMAARLEVSPRGLRLRMTQLGIGRRG
jgi:DNA-binding NtrC family response regulator